MQVLDEGQIVAFDKPLNLLQNKDSHLSKMVAEMGVDESKRLLAIANGSTLYVQQPTPLSSPISNHKRIEHVSLSDIRSDLDIKDTKLSCVQQEAIVNNDSKEIADDHDEMSSLLPKTVSKEPAKLHKENAANEVLLPQPIAK